ncbi:hypothetical protein GCM10025864_44960 [Luteimicrobium album]|uniref:RiboL-PSP-HEPN domain-containing protein n=2 Tax=Luteimicrobium album TaxID=1054550 RepID=A0ABQ6HUS2_9MICO|nr:hypothetical protein GCM10025864_00290 [Luteimicrobium album]GMA26675.1 hypothetical protein GCM10025864_44340 [Luteimicrobium album]GMA26737.1 hypothetical protein GCM10025864_44960 [Luteimicrobium album]
MERLGMGPKKKKCESFAIFEKNNARASFLIQDFTLARKAGRPQEIERALLQGAVVFSIGALDNFVHELILEIVPRFGGNGDALHEPLRNIARDDPALALRVALAPTPERRREELQAALDKWLESKSFHGVSAVVNGLKYCGVDLSEVGLPTNWRARVEHFTEMRHKIVHRGMRPSLTVENATECVDLMGRLAANINDEAVKKYHP